MLDSLQRQLKQKLLQNSQTAHMHDLFLRFDDYWTAMNAYWLSSQRLHMPDISMYLQNFQELKGVIAAAVLEIKELQEADAIEDTVCEVILETLQEKWMDKKDDASKG